VLFPQLDQPSIVMMIFFVTLFSKIIDN